MKTGILGGSFDPLHTGHAILANYVAQTGVVDEVWLMISRRNPLKGETEATESQRVRMAEIAAEKMKNVKVSDFELYMPSPSYTYDTLLALKKKYPDREFCIIIGSDSLAGFGKWRNSEKILKEFGALVYPRPGYPLPDSTPEGVKFLSEVPVSGLSSTFIREKIREGWNIDFFVPAGVAEYIRENNLYHVKK